MTIIVSHNKFEKPSSVLVIGATGGTGLQMLQQLYKLPQQTQVHAFCRTPDKLNTHPKVYHTIQTGNAKSPKDLEKAINETKADLIMLAVGNGASVKKSDTREACTRAIVQVLEKPSFSNIRMVVVSSQGAGTSKIKAGFGIGMLIAYHLKHVLSDHTAQEAIINNSPTVKSRTLVVRPTALTDDKPTVRIVEFGDKVKCPSLATDRSDLCRYVVDRVFGDDEFGGMTVNITGMKK